MTIWQDHENHLFKVVKIFIEAIWKAKKQCFITILVRRPLESLLLCILEFTGCFCD